MKKTGFEAYCYYIFIKNIHFKDNDFNIMKTTDDFGKKKLLSAWNKNRSNKDGWKFQKINNYFNTRKKLIRLFSFYYVNNSKFYINSLFEDEFKTYKNNIAELNNLEDTFTNDLQDIILNSKDEEKPLGEYFISNGGIPRIFKCGISWNSLIVFNEVFDIIGKNSSITMSELEKERWDEIKIKLRKYRLIVEEFINGKDWKTITKIKLNSLN